jgi:hypothetical protein
MGRDTYRIVARISDRRVLVLGAASLARNLLGLPTKFYPFLYLIAFCVDISPYIARLSKRMIEDVKDLQHVAMNLSCVAPWGYEGVLDDLRGEDSGVRRAGDAYERARTREALVVSIAATLSPITA